MIKINRGKSSCPLILAKKGPQWTKELIKLKLQYAKVKNKKRQRDIKRQVQKLEAKYNQVSVRTALRICFSGKCAYCESYITHVSYPQIEHYKPKSLFPAATYRWNNLLLACGICNGPEYKGHRFPGKREHGPLIDPCKDNPSAHLEFFFDPVTRTAEIIAKTARGKTTEKILGLNREDLRRYRSTQVMRIYVLGLLAKKNNDSEGLQLLKEARAAEAEYSAFVQSL